MAVNAAVTGKPPKPASWPDWKHKSHPKLIVGFLVVGLQLVGSAQALEFADTGPLRIRDQFLLNMGLLAFEPDTASVLASGESRVEVIETASNTFAMSKAVSAALEQRNTREAVTLTGLRAIPGNVFYLDAEVYRTAIAIEHGVRDGLQIGATWQWLSFIGGTFDGLIEGFHDAFNFEQGGRAGVPRGAYTTYVRSNGVEVFNDTPPGSGAGDVVLRAKLKLRGGPERSLVSLQASLKLPLGDGDELFSSGSVDAGVQLLGGYYLTDQFRINYSLGVLRLGRWDLFGLPSQTLLSGMVGLASGISHTSSVIAQLTVSESPFAGLGLPELGVVSMQASLGYKYEVDDRITLFGALTENIVYFDNSADVGFHLGASFYF